MKALLQLFGWLLTGIGAGLLALLPFEYEPWPQNLWGLAALGVGLLLVLATSEFSVPWRKTITYSSYGFVPWPVQALVLVAGLSLIAIPNWATIRGAVAQSSLFGQSGSGTAGTGLLYSDVLLREPFLADPHALQTGLEAIKDLAATDQFISIDIRDGRITATMIDDVGQLRTFDFRRPGTIGGGGAREVATSGSTTGPRGTGFTKIDADRIPEFVERAVANAVATGAEDPSRAEKVRLLITAADPDPEPTYHVEFNDPTVRTMFDSAGQLIGYDPSTRLTTGPKTDLLANHDQLQEALQQMQPQLRVATVQAVEITPYGVDIASLGISEEAASARVLRLRAERAPRWVDRPYPALASKISVHQLDLASLPWKQVPTMVAKTLKEHSLATEDDYAEGSRVVLIGRNADTDQLEIQVSVVSIKDGEKLVGADFDLTGKLVRTW